MIGDDEVEELHLAVGEIHLPHPVRPVFMLAVKNKINRAAGFRVSPWLAGDDP